MTRALMIKILMGSCLYVNIMFTLQSNDFVQILLKPKEYIVLFPRSQLLSTGMDSQGSQEDQSAISSTQSDPPSLEAMDGSNADIQHADQPLQHSDDSQLDDAMQEVQIVNLYSGREKSTLRVICGNGSVKHWIFDGSVYTPIENISV